MSGKLDWRRVRLAGKPNLDHRHEFEFEDRAARWLRLSDGNGNDAALHHQDPATGYPGKTIWARPSKGVRQDGKATRINTPHPETKESSLPQAIIARWSHDSLGINLGVLGQSD